MRRTVLYISLIVIAAAAITMYWMAHRSFVVKRAMIVGPLPRIPPHESLIGRMAPDFAGVDQDGRAVSTASLRGQVVMLNVWATWCKPCVEELPRIEKEIGDDSSLESWLSVWRSVSGRRESATSIGYGS